MEATRTETYQGVDSMNGLISYLAIYIGFVLVVACAAILTIQQLSGVSDAGSNYRILSELGTSRREIGRSVLVQQTIFFVFPLVVGIAHSAIALSIIVELVAVFGGLTIEGTVGFTALPVRSSGAVGRAAFEEGSDEVWDRCQAGESEATR